MFQQIDSSLVNLSIHHVGNRAQQGPLVLSANPVSLRDEHVATLLRQYFLGPFSKIQEISRFYHHSDDLRFNEVFQYTQDLFEEKLPFHEYSIAIAKHLYESSNHPNIKEGELYVVEWDQVAFEGQFHRAIGLFKSENKEAFLKVYPHQDNFQVDYETEAINIHKLDKGCLILELEPGMGYTVLALDQTNRQQEAVYWKDDFLGIKARNDAFQQTGNYLKVYKEFVQEKLDEVFEIEKADKMDLMNRSMDYFKKNEVFRQEKFEEEVLGDPKTISMFRDFQSHQGEAFEDGVDKEFQISAPAVRKMQATYKSVLKLDKNFHIYIHGKREYIEKGFDPEKGLSFYKIYFESEL